MTPAARHTDQRQARTYDEGPRGFLVPTVWADSRRVLASRTTSDSEQGGSTPMARRRSGAASCPLSPLPPPLSCLTLIEPTVEIADLVRGELRCAATRCAGAALHVQM